MYRKIFKNTSWLVAAQIFTKAVSFFYIIFLARNLGVENFGLYTVALSYFALISSVAEFGISRYVVREISVNKKGISGILPSVIFLRLVFMAVLFAFFALFLYLFDPLKMRVALSLLAVLAVLPQVVAISFDSIFVAVQKLSFSAVSLIVFNLATTGAGFILIEQGYGVFGAVSATIIGQVIYALCLVFFLIKQKINFLSRIKEDIFEEIIKGSLPYAFLGVLGLLYFRIDSLLISYFKGSYDTGIYGAAYKFLEAIVFVPSSLSIALFPVLAKLHTERKESIKDVYFKIFKFMGLLGLAVLIGYLLVVPVIIKIFLPKYLLSIEALRVLSFSIPFLFVYGPLSQIILSSDRYLREVIKLTITSLSLNILLNLLLIPKFSYMGASIATVASDVLTLVIISFFIQRKIFNPG